MNVLVVIGSPKESNSNSESIANKLCSILNEKEQASVSKAYLSKEITNETYLIKSVERADKIILITPVFENSVPGLVIEFFEIILRNKVNLSSKSRELFTITNTGYPEVQANQGALNTCRLFVQEMEFGWIGGVGVAPGTLINGRELDESGGIYKKLKMFLNIISEKIASDEEIPIKSSNLLRKPFMSPYIYRFVGGLIQKGNIKKIGKDKYFAMPLTTKNI